MHLWAVNFYRSPYKMDMEGRGKKVVMDRKDYMEEHKRLISMLDELSAKAKKESTKQKKEIKGGKKCTMCGGNLGMDIREVDLAVKEIKQEIRKSEAIPKTRPTNRKKAAPLFRGGMDMTQLNSILGFLNQFPADQSIHFPNPLYPQEDPNPYIDVILYMQEMGVFQGRGWDEVMGQIYREGAYNTTGDLVQLLRQRFEH